MSEPDTLVMTLRSTCFAGNPYDYESVQAFRLVDGGLELQICPRSHWKMVIVDGELGYCGSANFTGAGLGAKSQANRNLELGAVGRDPEFVTMLERTFDSFWMGDACEGCGRRDICPDPIR